MLRVGLVMWDSIKSRKGKRTISALARKPEVTDKVSRRGNFFASREPVMAGIYQRLPGREHLPFLRERNSYIFLSPFSPEFAIGLKSAGQGRESYLYIKHRCDSSEVPFSTAEQVPEAPNDVS